MLPSYSRILVVDDSETIRKIMRGLLYKLGFHYVREAGNGAEALAMIKTQEFELVISDWEMDPINGLQLLEAIRCSDRWRTLPFIMTTGSSRQKYAQIARDHGVTLFLRKPFTQESLGERIAALGATGRAA